MALAEQKMQYSVSAWPLAARVQSFLPNFSIKILSSGISVLTELHFVRLLIEGLIKLPISGRHIGLEFRPPELDALKVHGRCVKRGAQQRQSDGRGRAVALAALKQRDVYIGPVSAVAATRRTVFLRCRTRMTMARRASVCDVSRTRTPTHNSTGWVDDAMDLCTMYSGTRAVVDSGGENKDGSVARCSDVRGRKRRK